MNLSDSPPRPRWRRLFHAWAPLFLLLGAFSVFVFHGFGGDFPPGLNHDAAWHGLYAFQILNGAPWSIYTPEAFGHETPYYYVMAALFRLLGASKETIELTATLFGFLAVALFYRLILARAGNGWIALFCGLLWISSSALVLFSRVGWQLVTLIPAALLVILCCRFYLDGGARSGARQRGWAMGLGAASALTLYTYNGGRTILLFLPLFWIFRGVQVRNLARNPQKMKPENFRSGRLTLGDAIVSLVVFGLISAPMLEFAFHNWEVWNGRATSLLGESGGIAAKFANFLGSLGYFNVSARGDDFFTDFPVLEGPMLWLWIAGITFALFRFRVYWPELLLFALFLLPGVVTKPSFHRAVGTLPIVYVLSAYFLLALGRQLQKRAGEKRGLSYFVAALSVLVALQIGAGWKKLYLDKQPFNWGFYPETTVIGRYLHAHPDQKVVIYAGNWPKDALAFLATTDIKNPGGNFDNYQAYNTPSGDGLPEIVADLQSGAIARPAHFIVDSAKAAAFHQALQSGFAIKNQGELRYRDASIAQLFRVE